LYLQWIMMLLT